MRIFFLVLLLSLLYSPLAHAKRIALVIGNNIYENVGKLQKAVNDANAIADTLEKLEFEVIRGKNASRTEMNRLLGKLRAKIQPKDDVLFYFAGHGVSENGQNYLLPTDIPQITANLRHSLTKEAFTEEEIIALIQSKDANAGILIVDACRNNPFPKEGGRSVGRSVGLSRSAAPKGTFILYSAGRGQEALDRLGNDDTNPNSVFTRMLLPLLTKPGLNLVKMAKDLRVKVEALAATADAPYQNHNQFPSYYDEMRGNFIFVQGQEKQELALNTPPKTAPENTSKHPEKTTAEALYLKGTIFYPGKLGTISAYNKSFALFEKAADQNHAPAMAALGLMYDRGQGVKKDYSLAFKWYQKAAKLGDPAGKAGLAFLYDTGHHVVKDPQKASSLYQEAALAGNGRAMNNLGNAYLYGNGVKKDYHLAMGWFQRAAESGYTFSYRNIAFLYQKGKGVKQDLYKALSWYDKALDTGSIEVMHDLATLYENNKSLNRNTQKAAAWITKAIKKQFVFSITAMTTNSEAWSHEFRKEFQKQLTKEGVYTGKIDGNFGPATIKAIKTLASQ